MLMIWIIGLIVLAVFLIWRFWVQDWLAHRKVAETQNKLPAGIEVIEQGDKKIVRNTVEGYEVTVPKEWGVGAKTSDRVVLETKINNPKSEVIDQVVIINVFRLDIDGSLNEWLKNKISKSDSPTCYKIENPIQWSEYLIIAVEDKCQYGEPVKEYYTKIKTKIYSFQDLGAGVDEIKSILQSIEAGF